MRIQLIALAGLATLTAPLPLSAQDTDFQWTGTVREGQTVEIRGVNGAIQAMISPDASVRVEANRQARRSDRESVRIEVVQHGDGVTICAVYPTPRGARRDNECRPGGGPMTVQENDVRVDFTVHVPAGVRFAGHTVNGAIRASGLRSDVRAETVNGSVDVETTGLVRANTVNGGITARIAAGRLARETSFEAVNGSIDLFLPAGLNAELRASTVTGSIDSDFPITVSGNVSRRSLRGTIGDGGPELRASTVNGTIRLRRI
jgi:hypothetical protein